MKYQLKYIKNPPTSEDLINLFESELFNQLISEFKKRTKAKINIDYCKQAIRQWITRKFLILNIPFQDVQEELKSSKIDFVDFCVKRNKFYETYEDENPDGEFGEGDELDENDKSETIEEHGISKSFLLDIFCEFYLLKLGNKERLLHFLKTTKMPHAKKHLTEITKIYNLKK